MKSHKLIGIILLFTVFAGCQDVLDKQDLNVVDDQIWESENQATLYVNKLYQDNIPGMSLGVNSGFTDEAISSTDAVAGLMYGFIAPNVLDAITVLHKDKYQLIRRINICIEGLQNSGLEENLKAPIIGQALFLRAFRYWEFVKLYGGVPMVTNVQDPFTDDLNVPRSKTSESINQIMADLDQAIASLPVDWPLTTDQGRITSGAAAAFKARILLSWASPLFNPQNKQDRWQSAYDASKKAVELLGQMSVPRDLNPDFSKIFTIDILSDVEAVIYKRFSIDAGNDYTSGWEGSVRPPSAGGNGGFNPTWELVKSFPMANGKLIGDVDSGYDSTYFWQNRDPRFYATIAYNGAEWSMTGRTQTRQWNYVRNIHENNRTPSTGFYNRKATNPTVAKENTSQTSTTWHELRYAEVLMNLAESANETGKTNEALPLVRRIRERAGIESNGGTFGIPESISKEQLRELIMIERSVEFAFENKRYWDLRRRLMYRNDLGNNVKMMNGKQRHGLETVVKSAWLRRITDASSPYVGWNRIDTVVYLGHLDINNSADYNTYFTTNYKVMEATVNSQVQRINYISLYDFFAVTNSFIQSSPAVEQTVGWLNGTFDPLAE